MVREKKYPPMDYQKQKWKKFSEISRREKWLLIEAVLLHLWVGLMLKIIPFRWIPRLFNSRQFETPAQPEDQSRHSVSGRQSEVIDLIRSAIQRAGRVSPWRNRCLVSSLAGRCMLRRRKISSTISLGVAKNARGKTVAHAWITAGDAEIVSGGTSFHELFKF